MPRVKGFDQEEAIQQALALFWEKGYASTSLSDLTNHLGIGKGSFYATFTSKRNLFMTCFQWYGASKMEKLKAYLNSEPNIKTGIRILLEYNLDELLSDTQYKGCFMANIGSELGSRDDMIRDELITYYDMLHETIKTYLVKAEMSSSISPESFTNLVITFIIGMNQEIKIKRDRASYLASIDAILKLLD